jgi:hypothetical protein
MSKRAREQESTKRARLSTACFRFHKHGCDVSKAWLLEAYRLLPAEAARQCHRSRKQPPCRSRGFALAPTARQHQNRCSDEDEALERSTSLAALDRACCACSQERGTSLAALRRSAAPAVLQNLSVLAACCSTSLCWQLPATRQEASPLLPPSDPAQLSATCTEGWESATDAMPGAVHCTMFWLTCLLAPTQARRPCPQRHSDPQANHDQVSFLRPRRQRGFPLPMQEAFSLSLPDI